MAVKAFSTHPHPPANPSHVHKHIIQRHLTRQLPRYTLQAPSEAVLPEDPLKRRVRRLHRPPPPVAGETRPPVVAEVLWFMSMLPKAC